MSSDMNVSADVDETAQTTPETAKTVDRKYMIREDGRIVALRHFGNVRKGDVGGFVDSHDNLSHDDMCWVYDNACVRDDAQVLNNARVMGDAIVEHNACVRDNAIVGQNARIYGNAVVAGDAYVHHHACVRNSAVVCDNASVGGATAVCDSARVYGYAGVYGVSMVRDSSHVHSTTRIENVRVYDNARISGDAYIMTHTIIAQDAVVEHSDDVIVLFGVSPWDVTVYRTHDGFRIQAGCQNFTADELESVADDHEFVMEDWQKTLWSAILERTKAWHADGRGKPSTDSTEQ